MTALGRQTPIPGAQKDVSLQIQSCVNAFLGHNVLSVNGDFYVFALISYNCTIRRLPINKWQAVCFSQKTQVLDET